MTCQVYFVALRIHQVMHSTITELLYTLQNEHSASLQLSKLDVLCGHVLLTGMVFIAANVLRYPYHPHDGIICSFHQTS